MSKGEGKKRGLFERPTGSGIWWVRYVDGNGRLHREKVGPKGLATKVYEKRKTEVRERRFFPEQLRRREVTLAHMIDDYLKRNRGRLRSFYHYERYGRIWKAALPARTLREIVPGDVERCVAKRREEDNLKPASINRELAFLRRVFNVAIEDGLVERNPVRPKMFSKENNQRVRFLLYEDEAQLREKIGEAEWPVVAVAIHTGLRRSEQFGLRWEHIDFANRIITVPRSKNGETRRIPMNDTVRDIFRARPSRLKCDLVFPSGTGETPIDADNYMNRVFRPALLEAKIEDFTWHDLRHTFASRLVMAGVDLRTVQELMGHKTLQMTLRYSHLSPAHQLDAVQRLNRVATDTATDTTPPAAEPAVGGTAEVLEFPMKENGGAWTRTTDLGIMRPSL